MEKSSRSGEKWQVSHLLVTLAVGNARLGGSGISPYGRASAAETGVLNILSWDRGVIET